MAERKLIPIEIRQGIFTNETLSTIGPRLWKAQNAVWEYRYPHIVNGMTGPWLMRQPITFAYTTARTYNGSKSFRDIGYTANTGILSTPAYHVVMGADSSDIYRCWPAAGGAALAYDGTISPFTIRADTKRPGCSVYWDSPGNYPGQAATTGTIGLDYDQAAKTITRASGSFVTNGFVTGRSITVTKSTRNNGTYTLTNVTATVLTVAEDLVNETVGTSQIDSPDTATVGALIFSHREGDEVYYLMDDTTTIQSLTAKVANCPAGAGALTIHLDRLWLAHRENAKFSYVVYTDPTDLDSIRPQNSLRIPGEVLCLVPGQFGNTDVSGVPHLIIGTATSVWCLDGDPILGGGLQANLRQLTNGVGIPSPLAATITPFGVLFLGTDGDLWLIPPGCQTVISVGQPIRNVLGMNAFTGTADSLADNAPTGSLVWLDPYLYIFPGGETSSCYIAEMSKNGPTFWGPLTISDNLSSREAIIKCPQESALYIGAGSNKEGAHLVNSIDVTPSTSTARFLSFDEFVTPTGSYPNGTSVGRASYIQTGLITVPGHYVQPIRVLLETLKIPQTSTPQTVVWRVDVYDEKGNSVQGVLYPEPAVAAGTYSQSVTATQHFVIKGMPACRGVSLKISVSTEANLALQRAFIEVETTPASF